MQTRIANELVRTDLTAEIQSAIQDAMTHYEGHRFWFNEQRATAVTVTGQEFYPLPTDFIDLDSLVLTENSNLRLLEPRTMLDMDNIRRATTERGRPETWALYQEQFRLYPIPDAAYTLTVAYLRRLPALSAVTDTNAWMTRGEMLIRARAKKELYEHVMNDRDKAQRMERLEIQALAALVSQTEKRISTGRLTRTRF